MWRSLPTVRYYLRICLDELRKTSTSISHISRCQVKSFHPETSGIKTVSNSILYKTNFGREILFPYNIWIIFHYNTSIWGWGCPVGIVIRLRTRGLRKLFSTSSADKRLSSSMKGSEKIWVHPASYSMGQRALSLGERSRGVSSDLYVCLSFSTQKRITANIMSAQGK
jgi:hypothetical protein